MSATLQGALETAGDVAWSLLGHERVRLAVTGLSRAGKTVFLTSLVANLLAAGEGKATLPALGAAAGGRLRAARIIPAGIETTPRLDHAAHLAALAADPPRWPARTEDFSTLSLELVLERSNPLGGLLGPRTVRLDLLDYPGEWLLDLPMLEQDYASWSAATLTRLRRAPADAAAGFLAFVDALPPGAPADEALARQGWARYRDCLLACRDRHALRFLQPGRALNPGPRGEAPILWFFPLPQPRGGGLAALCAERFRAYLDDQRDGFMAGWLARFDRQVVLVDVLGALHAGEAAFADTRDALAAIAAGLGRRSLLQQLFAASPRIAYAATKADHVPLRSREALLQLLGGITGAGTAHTLAAIRCTEDVVATLEGRPVAAVRGVLLGSGRAATVYPGEVPMRPPEPGDWRSGAFEMPAFRPPRLDAAGGSGIPHLGLDTLLASLIGDLL